MQVVVFQKSGYDPFLDFIKAYSILCVLFAHTIPFLDEIGYCLWAGMAVPLFILIQVFHVFKNDTNALNIRKLFQRIFLPFILVQAITFGIDAMRCSSVKELAAKYIMGGVGAGSYYPWLYLQMAIVLYIVRPMLEKCTGIQKLIVLMLVCEVFEILLSLTGLSDSVYRFLPVRYFFLIYLGWVWVKYGIRLTPTTVVLSLLSMASIIYFAYFYIPTEPWFYDTAWRFHRWPCYFYASTFLCSILFWVYDKTKNNEFVAKSTKMLAKCSYEIFLLQMVVLHLMPSIDYTNKYALEFAGIKFISVWGISIFGGYWFNLYFNKIVMRKNK